MTKRIFLSLLSACLLLPAMAGASGFSNFPAAVNSDLKPFARDLGGVLGSGLNQTARVLGFSGFDIGVRGVMQFEPEKKNTILKKNNPFGLGFVQAEIGMPYRVDGFIRAGAYDGLALAGGGVRYGIRKVSDQPYYTQVMLVAMGNLAAHRYFYAAHFNSSLMFSVNVPGVSPYFGVGFDSTKLVAQTVTGDPSLAGKKVNVFEPRYTFGLRARLKLSYLALGVTRTHGVTLATAGAGIRF